MLIRTGPGVLLEFVCKWDTHLLLELRICEQANARKTTLGLSESLLGRCLCGLFRYLILMLCMGLAELALNSLQVHNHLSTIFLQVSVP